MISSDLFDMVRAALVADSNLAALMGGTVRVWREGQPTQRDKTLTHITVRPISETELANDTAAAVETVLYVTAWAPKASGDLACQRIADRVRVALLTKPPASGSAHIMAWHYDGNRPGVTWDEAEKMFRDDLSYRAAVKHT